MAGDIVGPDGVKIKVSKVEITLDPVRGLNVDVPDDPILALGLLDMARAVIYTRLQVKKSPITRVR